MNLRVARNLIIVICLFSPFYYLSLNMLANDLLPKTYIVVNIETETMQLYLETDSNHFGDTRGLKMSLVSRGNCIFFLYSQKEESNAKSFALRLKQLQIG